MSVYTMSLYCSAVKNHGHGDVMHMVISCTCVQSKVSRAITGIVTGSFCVVMQNDMLLL